MAKLKITYTKKDEEIILNNNLKQHPLHKHLYLNNDGTKIYSLKHNKFLNIYGKYYLRCTGGSLIHRLVAETYIENFNNKSQVNHIDGNKYNNYYLNLEWVTPTENLKHSYQTLKRKAPWEGKKMPLEIRNKRAKSIMGKNNPTAKHRRIIFVDGTSFEFYTRQQLLDWLVENKDIKISLSTLKNWLKNVGSFKKYGILRIEDVNDMHN